MRLWRAAAAALSALLLCGLALGCAQGSLTIIIHQPAADGKQAAALPSWEHWCTRGTPRQDRKRLAFCARVDGRVVYSTHGPGPLETHVALIGDFHIVIVRLLSGAATPANGARVVAIGPLFRARDGLREVQAFRFTSTPGGCTSPSACLRGTFARLTESICATVTRLGGHSVDSSSHRSGVRPGRCPSDHRLVH
jgi:hypothetical protein